jgi:predicted nucleic acid-binding protein
VSSAAASPNASRTYYSLQGIYFERRQFRSTADCMTAAFARGLPLALCQ